MQFSTAFIAIFATLALASPIAKRATAYNDLSISGGTAGNAKQEALDALGGSTDVDFLGSVNKIANQAEVGAFNPAIEAASGDEKQALTNGKIKNKVLKLTATIQKLTQQAADGEDVADKMAEETTKLNKNIALDKAAAGQASTKLEFDATTV